MDIAKVLQFGWAGKEYSLNGDTYEGLNWLDASPKPTLQEIEAKHPLYLADIEQKRKLAELPVQMDAVFNALPPEVRGAFYPQKAAVKLAFEQGDTLAALAIVQNAVVPPELQEVKDSLLDVFAGL
jgi:hypothetical protein